MYIGNSPTSQAFVTDYFNGDGTTVAYTMSVAPANSSSIEVIVAGVPQYPNTYSVNATTLTFSAAPPAGTGNIFVRYLGIPATGVTTTAYRTVTEFTATASQTTFVPPSYTVGYINVYQNGSLLGSADYTATNGTTVVLAVGATVGDLVVVESFYVSSVLNAIPAVAGAVGSTYLAASSVIASKIPAGEITPAKLNTQAQYTGFKNRIINGEMDIDQRNNGAAQTVTTAGTAYTLDRWTLFTSGANVTSQRVSASTAGYQYGWQITGASSNTAVVCGQRIESLNCWDLAGQVVTLSFKVYNSGSSTTMTAEPAYPTAVDNFASVTYFSSTTLTIPSGWSTQTYTFTANANCVNGLVIYHNFGALGAGVTRIITGYQLEKGSVATSFDYRPYGTELALCQRYFRKLGGAAGTPISSNGAIYMDGNGITFTYTADLSQMRAVPIGTLIGTVNTDYGVFNSPYAFQSGFTVGVYPYSNLMGFSIGTNKTSHGLSNTPALFFGSNTTSGFVYLSSEL